MSPSAPEWTVRATGPGPEIAVTVDVDEPASLARQHGQLQIAADLRADWDVIARSLDHGASLMLRAPSGRSHRISVTRPVRQDGELLVVEWSGSDVQIPGPRPVPGRHHRREPGD